MSINPKSPINNCNFPAQDDESETPVIRLSQVCLVVRHMPLSGRRNQTPSRERDEDDDEEEKVRLRHVLLHLLLREHV